MRASDVKNTCLINKGLLKASFDANFGYLDHCLPHLARGFVKSLASVYVVISIQFKMRLKLTTKLGERKRKVIKIYTNTHTLRNYVSM